MPTKTIMLSLISEQAIPNVMAPLLVDPRPDIMVCLLPKDPDTGQSDSEYKNIFTGINQAFQQITRDTNGDIRLQVQPKGPLDPYDFEGVKDACQQVRGRFPGDTIIYNVTGGTKVMAQAALEDAQAANHRVVYVDTEYRRLIWLWPTGLEPEPFIEERLHPIDVKHYLTAYGLGQQDQGHEIPLHFKQAAHLLAQHREGGALVKTLFSSGVSKDMPYSKPLAGLKLTDSQHNLLDQVVTCLREGGCSISLQDNLLNMVFDDDWLHSFWDGRRWLEWYAFSVLDNFRKTTTIRPTYQQPLTGVKIIWRVDEAEGKQQAAGLIDNELDVVSVRGGRLLICECKTGKKALKSEELFKFAILGKRLGTFADLLFVTDQPGLADPSYRNQGTSNQAMRALTLDIMVVGLEQLPYLADYFCEPDRRLREQKKQFGLL